METKKIIICRGIPGSGKSTYAKQWVKEDTEHRVRFNNDDIRNMLGAYWVPSRENLVDAFKKEFLFTAMSLGYHIIVDNMNLNPKEIKFFENIVDNWNNPKGIVNAAFRYFYEIEFKDFFISVKECIARDALRPNPVGEKAIKFIWSKYKNSIQSICLNKYINNLKQQDSTKPATIILDMDNTLCFNNTGRPWYGDGAAEGMLNDMVNTPIANLASIYSDAGYYVFIITGRDTSCKEATEQWLDKHKISYDKVFYRTKGNYNSNVQVKKEIIEQLFDLYNIELVIDDQEDVVKMYREMGLTVLQPNKLM